MRVWCLYSGCFFTICIRPVRSTAGDCVRRRLFENRGFFGFHARRRIGNGQRGNAVEHCKMAERRQVAAGQGGMGVVLGVQHDLGVICVYIIKRRADRGEQTALLGRDLFVGCREPQRHLPVCPAMLGERLAGLLPSPRLIQQDAQDSVPAQLAAQHLYGGKERRFIFQRRTDAVFLQDGRVKVLVSQQRFGHGAAFVVRVGVPLQLVTAFGHRTDLNVVPVCACNPAKQLWKVVAVGVAVANE